MQVLSNRTFYSNSKEGARGWEMIVLGEVGITGGLQILCSVKYDAALPSAEWKQNSKVHSKL